MELYVDSIVDGLVRENSIVTSVEEAVRNGSKLAIYKTKDLITEENLDSIRRDRNPLLGYDGHGTPVISDPDKEYKGIVGVLDRKLICNPDTILTLDNDRDAYTWAYAPETRYTNGSFLDAINAFTNAGYQLFHAPGFESRETDVSGLPLTALISISKLRK